jgi:hypothetical protein
MEPFTGEEPSLLAIRIQAAQNAGILGAGIPVPKDVADDPKNGMDLSKMIAYICIPGQYGLNISMSLLLRSLNIDFEATVIKQIDNIDFFRISDYYNGRFEISTRNPLEAEIMLASRQRI